VAKGQRRSNREPKKPKQPKPQGTGALPLGPVPAMRELTPVGGRHPSTGPNGRR